MFGTQKRKPARKLTSYLGCNSEMAGQPSSGLVFRIPIIAEKLIVKDADKFREQSVRTSTYQHVFHSPTIVVLTF